MKEIKLQNTNRVCLVDEADYEFLSKFKWNIVGSNQVMSSLGKIMARILMEPVGLQDVDHINGDGLDNRRKNLRCCTHQQNAFNHRHKPGSSGFTGVHYHKMNKKWWADISIDYKTVYIGSYDSPEEAAIERDKVARKLHGEYAKLNFPEINGS